MCVCADVLSARLRASEAGAAGAVEAKEEVAALIARVKQEETQRKAATALCDRALGRVGVIVRCRPATPSEADRCLSVCVSVSCSATNKGRRQSFYPVVSVCQCMCACVCDALHCVELFEGPVLSCVLKCTTDQRVCVCVLAFSGPCQAVSLPDENTVCCSGSVFAVTRALGPSGTQRDVYASVRALVGGVMEGRDACVFAYGGPTSGKSFTMMGKLLSF